MIGLERGIVKLIEYQNTWKAEAEKTISELKLLLPDVVVDIQHIGSTAIFSIHAKPIIDIALGVNDLSDIKPYIEVLNNNHYIFRGEDVSNQILFVKGDFEKNIRAHHIHVVNFNGIEWNNYINFRDYLNAFPEKAKLYDMCKLNLSNQFPQDRNSYTKGKQALVSQLLEEANVWKKQSVRQ